MTSGPLCPRCGTANDASARFCGGCGVALADLPTEVVARPAVETAGAASPPPSGAPRWLLPVLGTALALLLIGGTVAWAATRDGDDVTDQVALDLTATATSPGVPSGTSQRTVAPTTVRTATRSATAVPRSPAATASGTPLPGTATRTAGTPTPARTATATRPAGTPRTPAEVVQALKSPFPPTLIPNGFSDPRVVESEPGDSAKQFKAVGQVVVAFRGPEDTDSIVYIVFPTNDDARRYHDAPDAGRITGSFRPTGISDPATCQTFTSREDEGGSICFVRVDNVEVVGVSLLEDDLTKGDNESALALARAGVQHLKALRGN